VSGRSKVSYAETSVDQSDVGGPVETLVIRAPVSHCIAHGP